MNEKLKAVSEQLHLPPMKYVVRITVDSVWDMGPGPHAGEELLGHEGVPARHHHACTQPGAVERAFDYLVPDNIAAQVRVRPAPR